MKRGGSTVALLLVSGCGVPSPDASEDACPGCEITAETLPTSAEESSAEAAAAGTVDGSPPVRFIQGESDDVPIDALISPGPVIADRYELDPAGVGSSSLDPGLGPTIMDPDYIDDLLTYMVDGLVIDFIAPTGTPGGFTYLELLCRDLDLPDSYCRQRYGP